MEDAQRLLVSLEGRFTKYEKEFERTIRKTDSNFRTIEKRAKQSANSLDDIMAGAFKGVGAGLLGGIVGGLAVGGLDQIITRVADINKGVAEIGDQAKKAGLSTKAFQELKFVAEQNRVSVDGLTDGMKELNLRADEWITTGSGSGAESFKRLGFSADELKRKLADPSALLSEIISRVQNLDKAAQIRVFDELFGGTGGEQFVQLISQGADGIRKTVKEANDLGLVLDDQLIKKADEIDRKFNAIATTVGTTLKSAVVSVVSGLADMTKTLNNYGALGTSLAANRLTAKYQEIEDAKASLAGLLQDKSSDPTNPLIDFNIEKQVSLLADLKKEAMEIRDFLDRQNGYTDTFIYQTGDDAKNAKPPLDKLNNALANSGTSASSATSGLKTFGDAIRALKNDVPELAAELAKMDAESKIDQTYRFALSKSQTMGEVYLANQLRGDALKSVSVKSATDDPTKYLSNVLASGKSMDSLNGLENVFAEKLAKMLASAPDNIRASTQISSGYRTDARQAELYAAALKKYGSPEAARKWVAPPGSSQHNKGNAADLSFKSNEAQQWFHGNADQFGLSFPLSNENWHIEDKGARQKMDADQFATRAKSIQDQATSYRSIVSGAQEYIGTQRQEAQALTMATDRAAIYRKEQELLQQAQRAGIPLSDQQRQQISQLAAEMANSEQYVQNFTKSQEEAAQVSRFFGEQAVDSLTGILTGSMTAADAMKNLANAMVKASLQALILGEGPLANLFGGGTTPKAGNNSGGGGGLGIIGSLLGFLFKADGGHISGPGTGTSDSIPAMLSNGEFVVNAKQTKKHRAVLEAINSGHVSAFANGGSVGAPPTVGATKLTAANQNTSAAATPNISINAPVTVNASGGTKEQNADLSKRIQKDIKDNMRGVVVQELMEQMRPGNMLGNMRR